MRLSALRARLPFVAAALLAVVAAFVILSFRESADRARQSQLSVSELGADAHHLSSIEWRAVAESGVEPEVAEQRAALRLTAQRHLRSLDSLAGDRGDSTELRRTFATFADAIDDELALVERNRIEEAREVDEQRVDPAFVVLRKALVEVSAREGRDAAAANRRATIGTVLSLGLAAALILFLFSYFERKQRRASEKRTRELERQALHDALTGLPNRRKLMADLDQVPVSPSMLAIFDLDGFKAYNDTFGHPEGDLLLQRLSGKLAAAVEDRGTAYRLGGDEFCLLLPEAGADAGAALRACGAALFEEGEGFRVQASYGGVKIPSEAYDAASALRIADRRMYEHKAGRSSSARQQTRDLVLRVLAEQHPDVYSHANAVAVLAKAVGERLSLEDGQLEDVVRTAELHDVGKIAIPVSILEKPGRLDDAEWSFINRHTLIGENMLSAAPALARIAKLVRSTHERFDGAGYPDSLAGADIPLASRIVFVCDSFHAMTSDRPYGLQFDERSAVAELERCAGSQFDPAVVQALVSELAARQARPESPGLALAY